MAKYRSAKGKTVDMGALATKNERVKAVGNMKVNARGDIIDASGNIVVPVNKKVSDRYAKTVTNRAANIVKKTPQPIKTAPKPEIAKVQLTKEEIEFIMEDEENEEVEAIKAEEVAKEVSTKETKK